MLCSLDISSLFTGEAVPLTWTKLASTASSGSSTLRLVDPVDWKVGDEIIIATTGHHLSQSESEKNKVAAISADKKTLTLNSLLLASHLGAEETFDNVLVEIRGEVGLLTHNVVVRGNRETQWDENIEPCHTGFSAGVFTFVFYMKLKLNSSSSILHIIKQTRA